jgi:hypothetical protein
MIMQPMFPLGDLNVATFTVTIVLSDVVVVVVLGGVVTVSLVDPDPDGVTVEKLKLVLVELLEVLVTVTVFVPPDPHPARTSATAMAAPIRCFTACSLPIGPAGERARAGPPGGCRFAVSVQANQSETQVSLSS